MTQLIVQERFIDQLTPYPRNARTHSDDQIAQIMRSIERFGFTNPVLIDADDMIIAGHGRVIAADRLGWNSVPCIVLDHLDDDQKRAYILADNRIALNAGWSDELIRGELEDLQRAGFNLDVLGFDDSELKRLLDDINVEPPSEFQAFDENIATEHQCPACGYRWSGKATPRGLHES